MNRVLLSTRNIYINSENESTGADPRNIILTLPQGAMDCANDQHMRVSVSSFAMRVQWNRVNTYNNKFFIVAKATDGTIRSSPIVIPEGQYQSFDDAAVGLGTKTAQVIKAAVNDTGGDFAIADFDAESEYDSLSGRLTFKITKGTDNGKLNEMKFVSFTIINYQRNPGNIVDEIIGNQFEYLFTDTMQLLGGCSETRSSVPGASLAAQYDNITSLFTEGAINAGQIPFVGGYQATLQTNEQVFLHSNLATTDYQTNPFGFPCLTQSRILAAIPGSNANAVYTKTQNQGTLVQRPYDLLTYMDNGDNLFSVILREKSVSSLHLSVRDSYGRLLPFVSEEQKNCRAMPWTAVLRVDVFAGSVA